MSLTDLFARLGIRTTNDLRPGTVSDIVGRATDGINRQTLANLESAARDSETTTIIDNDRSSFTSMVLNQLDWEPISPGTMDAVAQQYGALGVPATSSLAAEDSELLTKTFLRSLPKLQNSGVLVDVVFVRVVDSPAALYVEVSPSCTEFDRVVADLRKHSLLLHSLNIFQDATAPIEDLKGYIFAGSSDYVDGRTGLRAGGALFGRELVRGSRVKTVLSTIGFIGQLPPVRTVRETVVITCAHSVNRTLGATERDGIPFVRRATMLKESKQPCTSSPLPDLCALRVQEPDRLHEPNFLNRIRFHGLAEDCEITGQLVECSHGSGHFEKKANIVGRVVYAFGHAHQVMGNIAGGTHPDTVRQVAVLVCEFPAQLGPGDSGAAVFWIENGALEVVGILSQKRSLYPAASPIQQYLVAPAYYLAEGVAILRSP